MLTTVTSSEGGRPLSGAQVMLSPLGRLSRTDSAGRAALREVPIGTYTVVAKRMGYAPESTTVLTAGEDTVELQLILTSRARRLATVTVHAEAPATPTGEFEARRASATGGRFVTRAELDAAPDASLGGIFLRLIPGLRTEVVAGGLIRVYTMRGAASLKPSQQGRCEPVVYFDGVLLGDGDVGRLRMDDLGGIEFYPPDAIPPRYRQPGALRDPTEPVASPECGVLLLWSRV